MEIITKSDDPIVRVLDAVEKIKEEIKETTDGQISGFAKQLDESSARLRSLEDKITNPSRRYVPLSGDTDRAAARYLVDFYRATSGPFRDSPEGIQWRADQTSTTTAGGYLIPTPVAAEVLRIVETYGVARRLCRRIPMDRDKLNFGQKNASPSVYWQTEGSAPSSSSTSLTQIVLDSETLIAINEVTMQLQDDAVVDVAQYIIDVFSEQVAKEEDKQAFNSTTPFTGLLQASSIGVHTIASTKFTGTLTYDDFRKCMFKASAFTVGRGTWLMSTDLYSEVAGIKDTNGRPLFSDAAPPGNGNAPVAGSILGRPVVLSEVMPKSSDDATGKIFLAYGDFSHLLMGDRRQVSFDWDDSVGFKSATRWLRVMERVAFVVSNPSAFSVMKTA